MAKIHSELRTIWITPDGFKFFSKKDPQLHCEEFNLITNNETGENDVKEV